MANIEVSHGESRQSPAEKAKTKELHEQLSKKQEAAHEQARKSAEKDQSHRKQEAERQIAELAKTKKEHEQKPTSENRQPATIRSKADKEYGFRATMHSVRKEMSAPERQFSKFIHRPVVEKVSEVAGKTVARPSGIAGAAVAAFIGLLTVYGIAKFAGFTLSGSEMPLLLAGGFIMGLITEWLVKSLRSIVSS